MPSTGQPAGLRRPNDPPVLVLTSLAGGPKHGHALAKDIKEFGGLTLGPRTLAGAIRRLEGSIVVEWAGGGGDEVAGVVELARARRRALAEPQDSEDRRRPYRITATGSADLAGAL